jgi:phage terminase large subunit-like protein
MATAGEAFFDALAIDQSTETDPEPAPHSIASVGADFGFRSDSSALVAAFREPLPAQRIVIPMRGVIERTPEKRTPLKPSVVVREFAAHIKGYGADRIIADGHYRQAIAEHLEAEDLSLVSAPEGANGKAETYQAVRALFREGRLRIPAHERLVRQLREVTARPTAGGGISIVSPRWRTGGHGDLVAALVLAVWDAGRGIVEAPKFFGTPIQEKAEAWVRSIREDQERYETAVQEENWAILNDWEIN